MSYYRKIVEHSVLGTGLFKDSGRLASQGDNLFMMFQLTDTGKAVMNDGLNHVFIPQGPLEDIIHCIEVALKERGEEPAQNIDLGVLKEGLQKFPDYLMVNRLENLGYFVSPGYWEYQHQVGELVACFEVTEDYAKSADVAPATDGKYYVGYTKQALIDLIADMRRVLTKCGKDPQRNTEHAMAVNTLAGYKRAKASYEESVSPQPESLEP